jgi:ADP-dependent NAD(P)H-hydrate dehydratase / NAD(P)H-hydrate epimerase
LALFSQPFRSGGDRVCCGLLSSGAHYAGTVIPVLTPTEARALDAAAPVPVSELISRAGAAVARSAVEMLGGIYGRTVNVIAGPGNNGADARDAAARLSQRGIRVRIWDPAECPQVLPAADLVIDGAYGTGFRGSWEAPRVGNTPVLAVDIPSGLDALTGKVTGTVLAATRTVTFAAGKPGVYLGEGPQVCGEVVVADIGLDVSGASIDVVTPHDVAERWPQRPRHAHKWSTAVRMIAGSSGMTGAAHLASAAAMRSGAGIVHLSSPGIETDSLLEVVGRSIPGFDWSAAVLADLHRFGALVIGPGLGRGEHTAPSVVDTITQALCPVVIDGDGLFAVTWNAQGPGAVLRSRRGATVLTPHDGEFALLAGSAPGPDRIAAARSLAAETDAVVLLKGPTTVVADPLGQVLLVTNGSARLATAGTGDVLAGIIGTLLAGGVTAMWAAAMGAFVHAEAARLAPGAQLIASDLLTVLADMRPEAFGEI